MRVDQARGRVFWGFLLGLVLTLGNGRLLAQERKDHKEGEGNPNALVEVTVKGVALQPGTCAPIMVLVDKARKKALPIWIGFSEAQAIAMGMEHEDTLRPMTHDLMKNMLTRFEAKVKKVTITELKNGTFYAVISFLVDNSDIAVDSRPSDAVALAVRLKSPVYVVRKVLDNATTINLTKEKLKDENENWRNWLEELNPTPPREGQKLEL